MNEHQKWFWRAADWDREQMVDNFRLMTFFRLIRKLETAQEAAAADFEAGMLCVGHKKVVQSNLFLRNL